VPPAKASKSTQPAASVITPNKVPSSGSATSELKEIKFQLQNLNHNYSELLSRVDEIASLVSRVESLELQLEEMTSTNENQQRTISDLQMRLNHAEQYTRRDSLEIRDVPYTANEDVEEIVRKVAQNLNVPLTNSDISIAHRLKAKRGFTPGIIVKFTSRKAKNSIIDKKKNLTLTRNDFVPGDYDDNRIFIGHSLSPFYRRLLMATKNKARELGYRYIWWKNGVCVRKDNNEPIIKIENMEEILTNL